MKQKSKRKKRSSTSKPSGDGAAPEGSKKNLEEEKRDDERNKELEKTRKSGIESLVEAFCSISLEEATAAYNEAGGDLNKAAEILSVLMESGDDPSTSSVASMSSGQETGSSSDYGAGSSLTCSEDLTRDRYFKKQNRVIAATGMVSSVIGKDYMKPKPVQKENSKELCRSGKKAADREEAEQFLNSILGDDCELSMAVVREVLCQCGYDVDKALNILLEMSSSSIDDSLSGRCFGIGVSDSLAETSFDTDTSESDSFWGVDYGQSRDYLKALTSSEDTFATSQGNDELGVPQKVLESLFNVRQSTKHKPKTMNWRNIAKKMQSLSIDTSSSSGEEYQPDALVKEDDGYHELRKGADNQWNVTKTYYQKAAEAYSKGGRAHAAYLADKGRDASKLAHRADERASQNIFVARNKCIENVVTIDLHGQHVKQAMKLLKLHLLFGSYVSSIQSLRVITGCGSHGFGKSKVKHSVIELLEREGVGYYEENRGTVMIKLEGYSKEFSFLDTESDSE